MTRRVALVLFAAFAPILPTVAAAQNPAKQSAADPPDESNPPEEDESVAPKKYILNPLEAERNIKIGDFYWNKKNYRGALSRYKDATRYNPSSVEGFLKLGEAAERLNNGEEAKAAFRKVIALAPDSKFAVVARKKLASKS